MSALAERREIASAVSSIEGAFEEMWAIVMSAPIVENGHEGCEFSICGSGSKDISKGCAPRSVFRRCFRSMSNFDVE